MPASVTTTHHPTHARGHTPGPTGSRVLVEQTAAVDPQRLGSRVGALSFDELRAVDAALRTVLGLSV